MAGKEAYANPFSLIGDVGKSYKTYYIGRLLEKFNIALKQYPDGNLHSIDGVSKFPISMFHELTAENKALHEKIVKEQKAEIVNATLKRRQNAMRVHVGFFKLENNSRATGIYVQWKSFHSTRSSSIWSCR